jgi:hypothetical protein
MTWGASRSEVRRVACRLFAERRYSYVTIREIAAKAGVSPATMMRLGGSKQQLYAEATPPDPAPLGPDWPRSRIGRRSCAESWTDGPTTASTRGYGSCWRSSTPACRIFASGRDHLVARVRIDDPCSRAGHVGVVLIDSLPQCPSSSCLSGSGAACLTACPLPNSSPSA